VGLDNKRIALISEGCGLHARNLAENLKGRLEGYTVEFYNVGLRAIDCMILHAYSHVDWSKIDILWNVGLFFNIDELFHEVKTMYPEIKIINHWVGTDILNARSFFTERPRCMECWMRNIDLHIADDHHFIEELKAFFDVEARFVPTLPTYPLTLKPLPERFAVGVYMPPHRHKFYRYDFIVEVARRVPEIPFYFFALDNTDRDKTKPPSPNIHFMGYKPPGEKEKWWERMSVFMIFVVHGGLGVTQIEALQMGRYVICDKEYPYVIKCKTVDEVVEELRRLQRVKEPNEEASEYYRKEYSPESLVKYTEEALKCLE